MTRPVPNLVIAGALAAALIYGIAGTAGFIGERSRSEPASSKTRSRPISISSHPGTVPVATRHDVVLSLTGAGFSRVAVFPSGRPVSLTVEGDPLKAETIYRLPNGALVGLIQTVDLSARLGYRQYYNYTFDGINYGAARSWRRGDYVLSLKPWVLGGRHALAWKGPQPYEDYWQRAVRSCEEAGPHGCT